MFTYKVHCFECGQNYEDSGKSGGKPWRCGLCGGRQVGVCSIPETEGKDPTQCSDLVDGKECADQGRKHAQMCQGCSYYWTEAAKLQGVTPDESIEENMKPSSGLESQYGDGLGYASAQ